LNRSQKSGEWKIDRRTVNSAAKLPAVISLLASSTFKSLLSSLCFSAPQRGNMGALGREHIKNSAEKTASLCGMPIFYDNASPLLPHPVLMGRAAVGVLRLLPQIMATPVPRAAQIDADLHALIG